MIIHAISDLHGYLPKLDGGDLLILGGDYTATNAVPQWNKFFEWLKEQSYKHLVFIAGNHDGFLKECVSSSEAKEIDPSNYDDDYHYLIDETVEINELKIHGTPWSLTFNGINPKCTAFTYDTEDEIMNEFKLIQEGLDILISHTPPYGILDQLKDGTHVGSKALRKVIDIVKPKHHIFGHIHENGGKYHYNGHTHFYNVSHVNELYKPTNKFREIKIQNE